MSSQVSYTTISENEIVLNNEYPIKLLHSGKVFDLEPFQAIYFEDAGMYDLHVLEDQNYSASFIHIAPLKRVPDDGNYTNRVVLNKLAELKAKCEQCCRAIDVRAEEIRALYITPGSGQALVYMEKRREAQLFKDNPSVEEALIPHLVREAAIFGMTVAEKSDEILAQSAFWQNKSAEIEEIRLSAKKHVSEAQTMVEMENRQRLVDWSSVLV